MSAGDRPIWFVGDRTDPAAAAIAQRLPPDRTRLVAARAQLPRFRLRAAAERPRLVVVHRATLGRGDHDRLARLRTWLGELGRIVLCVGPHARMAEVERWLALADLVIPDALASSTISRQVAAVDRSQGPPAREPAPLTQVAVVSRNHALRATLASLLRTSRFGVAERAELDGNPIGAPPAPGVVVAATAGEPIAATIWDVPALDLDWPDRLRRATRAGLGPVVALIGFLDTRDLRTARAAGASLVLDLPVDAADLIAAVRETARGRRDPAHAVPPSPRRVTSRSGAQSTGHHGD